jgi:beta-phosphoglucomutase
MSFNKKLLTCVSKKYFEVEINMLKAIIFDMDGVLVDSVPFHADAWIKVFKDIGINVTRRDIYLIEGLNDKKIIEIFFQKARKKPKSCHFRDLVNEKRKILEFDQIEPFKGVLECLMDLKKHFRLATVSGANRDVVEKVMNKFFPNCFEVIITGDDLECGKPNPDPYLKALEKLDLTKNECIVIENSPIGITAAKRAELYCVSIASTLEPEELQQADLVFENHASLFDYLISLNIK